MISMLNFADTKIVFVYAHAKDVEFNILNALLQLRKAEPATLFTLKLTIKAKLEAV